jgi:hypothetical protein
MFAGSTLAASAAPLSTTISTPAIALAPAQRLRLGVGGCAMFPADNAWNTPIDNAPIRAGSAATIAEIQATGGDFLHADFGENPTYGIPFVVVPATQPLVPIVYNGAADESDPGPFPIPLDAPIESGSDRHVLVVQQGTCRLYELYAAARFGQGFAAYSGAMFDLNSNALRTLGFTSADAAGLPILPGLVRYDEVANGTINHAIRVTFATTQRGYILPATHFASSNTNASAPPMGLRLRLKANFDLNSLSGQARVIAAAFQKYGLIVADNGSNWFFQGAPDPGWNDVDLNQLKAIPGTDFEVVDTGPTLH